MNGTADGGSALATWGRLAYESSFYLLPAVGAFTLGLGCTMFLGLRTEIVRYLPLALVLAGLATLFGSVSTVLGSRPRGTVSPAPSPSHVRTAPSREPAHRPRPPRPRRAREPSGSGPISGIGRAAASAVATGADALWRRWTVPKSASLGAELVGPVPETAYSPPKPGTFVPFPTKDEDILIADSRGVRTAGPLPPSKTSLAQDFLPRGDNLSFPTRRPGASVAGATRPDPFTPADLDRLFPTETEPPVSGSSKGMRAPLRATEPEAEPTPLGRPSPTAPTGGAQSRSPAMPAQNTAIARAPWVPSPSPSEPILPTQVRDIGPQFGGTHGLLPTLDSLDHEVYLESIHLTPPHLRNGPSTKPSEPIRFGTGTVPRVGPGRFCTDCLEGVSDFRSWSDCPECGSPICRDCLSSSFLRGAEGHCSDCRGREGSPAS